MANCDMCNATTSWDEGTDYTADEFRQLVANGLVPDISVTSITAPYETREQNIARWKSTIVAQTTTDWLLCPVCAARAAGYLPNPRSTTHHNQFPEEQAIPTTPFLLSVAGRVRIFISHSSTDRAFANALAAALRRSGADVWLDTSHLGTGELVDEITSELRSRPIFIVVLSKAAFNSEWVRRECKWAFNLFDRDQSRLILPVVASKIDVRDFDDMLFLEDFRRIEGPQGTALSHEQAISGVLEMLLLSAVRQDPRALILNDPDASADDLIEQGKALNTQKRYSEGLQRLLQATQKAPHAFDAWLSLSTTYGQLGQFEEALAAAERALQIRPNSASALSKKGAILEGLGRLSDALIVVDQALALDPNLPLAWYTKGRIFGGVEKYEEALTALDHALDHNAYYADAWNAMGAVLNALGRYDEALAANDRALTLEPDYVSAAYGKALALFRLGHTRKALAAYQYVLTIDPNYAAAWNGVGQALQALGRYEEAIAAFDRALSLDPSVLVAWGNKALALITLGRYEEAQQAAEQQAAWREQHGGGFTLG